MEARKEGSEGWGHVSQISAQIKLMWVEQLNNDSILYFFLFKSDLRAVDYLHPQSTKKFELKILH